MPRFTGPKKRALRGQQEEHGEHRPRLMGGERGEGQQQDASSDHLMARMGERLL
jgi:hypothetical protein